jgi:hypothetical protein
MALRQTKKISELPALSPASLDTTFVVGISGSTTYKISINQLTSSLDTTFATDLVTNALSSSLDGKLSTSSFNSYTASISTASLVISITNLNSATSSYETKGRGIWSGSAQLPTGVVSGSSQVLGGSGVVSGSISYAYITYVTEPEVPNDDANGFLKPDGNISGSISYNQTTGYFTLLAGKTYKLRAVVNMSGGGSAFQPLWNLQWKDVTNNNFIGKQSIYAGDGEAFAIITPNTNIQVGLRSLSNPENSHPYIIKNSTFFFIEELR